MTSRAPAWAVLAIVAGATMVIAAAAAQVGTWLAGVTG